MDFVVPYDQLGIQPPGPWQNASPAAGTKGSIVNALVFPALQNEILNVIQAAIAAGLGITPSGTDLTQLLQAIKYLIPKYAPAVPGATSKGGLALDANNNFLLSLIANLNADSRSQPVGGDVIPLGRAADGAMVSISAADLGAYIASLFQQNTTFAQITATNLAGLSVALATGGSDFAVSRGLKTTVPLAAATVSPSFGSVSNGVLTVAKSGYYIVTFAGSAFISSNGHTGDFGTFVFNFVFGGGGDPFSGNQPIASGGGQAASNFVITTVAHLNAGDQVYLQLTADNFFHDGTNAGISGYSNMLVALLNS